MFTIHEGEIIIKEKYGSSQHDIYYVKPPAQENLVILDENKTNDIVTWFTSIFLPQGYPNSVSKDYLAYQIWDTAQAFCSTITGTLATQEVLRGVGVGSTETTPLAATITWVIKDGCGHLGRIVFAFSHGSYLDAYSKKWRLYADTLNDAAMCLEIALPFFKNYTTAVLCISTIMKAIVGVAGGATRAAMTQHHAVRGNMADVSAKDSAQETAVNLVASVTALGIISVFGNSISIFLLMMVLHITFNYFAVRAVCLRTFNEPRFLQLIDVYLKQEAIATPCEINSNEPIVFYQLGPNLLDLKLSGFHIKVGCSMKRVTHGLPKANDLKAIKQIYMDRQYMLFTNISKREMYIMVKTDAQPDDILCAYFHAVLLCIIICAINDDPSSGYTNAVEPRPFTQVCQAVQSADWSREVLMPTYPDTLNGFQYGPSIELMRYVDKIVQKEWLRVRSGLVHVGWDLSKHLIIMDEWRIVGKEMVVKPISYEDLASRSTVDTKSGNIISAFDNVLEDADGKDILRKNSMFTIEPEKEVVSPPVGVQENAEAVVTFACDASTPIPTKYKPKHSAAGPQVQPQQKLEGHRGGGLRYSVRNPALLYWLEHMAEGHVFMSIN